MPNLDALEQSVLDRPRTWLVTGAAGFIGSHLTEALLRLDQSVVALDNLSTGYIENIDDVVKRTSSASRLRFIEGDIGDLDTCQKAVDGVDVVLHQAALGSVPRSIDDPLSSHASNVNGFINLLEAVRTSSVERFVYASSSSVYGDEPSTQKVEGGTGSPLSPYAATKVIDETYAAVYHRAYGVETVGLRYFNVFGPRQDPKGAYAAVIPRWTKHLLDGEPCLLFGDGNKSRDFCYIENVVQANLLSATVAREALEARVFNIACGERTTLLQLFELIRDRVSEIRSAEPAALLQQDAKPGDIAHSLANIERARRVLGYEPSHDLASGLDETIRWFAEADHPHAMRGGSMVDASVA